MAKKLDVYNLFKDLEYTLYGTECHQFLFKVMKPAEGQIILEPGCGSGKLSLSYALGGAETIMLDVDPEVVEYARRLRNALNALLGFSLPTQIKLGSLFSLRLAKETFDLVFNEGVPQHWPDEEKRQGAIDLMAGWSRDYVVVIGNNGLRSEEQKADESFEFTYMGMPPKRKCFTPDELEMRLKKAGLKKVEVEPVTPGRMEDSGLIGAWGRKS